MPAGRKINTVSYSRNRKHGNVPFGAARVARPTLRLRAVFGDVALEEHVSVHKPSVNGNTHEAGAVVALAALHAVSGKVADAAARITKNACEHSAKTKDGIRIPGTLLASTEVRVATSVASAVGAGSLGAGAGNVPDLAAPVALRARVRAVVVEGGVVSAGGARVFGALAGLQPVSKKAAVHRV